MDLFMFLKKKTSREVSRTGWNLMQNVKPNMLSLSTCERRLSSFPGPTIYHDLHKKLQITCIPFEEKYIYVNDFVKVFEDG
jgi:hypothetical protein